MPVFLIYQGLAHRSGYFLLKQLIIFFLVLRGLTLILN